MAKEKKKPIVKKRLIESTSINISELTKEEKDKKDYENLKRELKNRVEDDIRNKISTMKILLDIRNRQLFRLDGYKKFDDFIADFKIAKTQAYKYIKLALLLQEGKLSENLLIEKGVEASLLHMIEKSAIKSKQNPLKPLRFQLKDETAYKYYKQHMKFTSWLLEKIFKERPELIKEFEEEYKIEK